MCRGWGWRGRQNMSVDILHNQQISLRIRPNGKFIIVSLSNHRGSTLYSLLYVIQIESTLINHNIYDF